MWRAETKASIIKMIKLTMITIFDRIYLPSAMAGCLKTESEKGLVNERDGKTLV